MPQMGSEIERFLKYVQNQRNLNFFKNIKSGMFAVKFSENISFHLY